MESVWIRFLMRFSLSSVFGVPCFYFGLQMARGAGGGGDAFTAVGLLALSGIIFSVPFVDLFAHPITGFIFPSDTASKPIVSYARADKYIRDGRYQDALEAFGEILTNHPLEMQAYVGEICLLVQIAHNPQLAKKIYTRGMKKIKDKDQRKTFAEIYGRILAKTDRRVDCVRDLVYYDHFVDTSRFPLLK